MALTLKFKINDQEVNLSLEDHQADSFFKLTNDDEFTITYLKTLIENKFITIDEEITQIVRVEDENDIPIYQNNLDTTAEDETENGPKKDGWGDAETRLLLDRYELYLSMVGPLKRFKRKKQLWEQIAADLHQELRIIKTPLQVENRFKTVMKRKKTAINNNNRTGQTRAEIPFEEELSKIAAVDDSIEPEVLQSAQRKTILKPKNATTVKKESTKTVGNILNMLRQQKEEHLRQREDAKERRHKEKMELLKAFVSSFNQGNSSKDDQ